MGSREDSGTAAIFVFAIIVVVAFFARNEIAAAIYPAENAPWETVDGYYFPDKLNPIVVRTVFGLKGVAECRAAMAQMARSYGQVGFFKDDYECAVGRPWVAGDKVIYRATLR